MTKPDNRISDKVICRGIVNPDAAAKGSGDANVGFAERYVFRGLACTLVLRVKKASPVYDILKIPRNLSSARSPTSSISNSGGVDPIFSSVTMISSTMIGGFGDLLRAVVNISLAREVSAIRGDQLKLKAISSMKDIVARDEGVLMEFNRWMIQVMELILSRACLWSPRERKLP